MKFIQIGRVAVFAEWFDCWIGLYYNQQKRRLYVMVPFVGIWFDLSSRPEAEK